MCMLAKITLSSCTPFISSTTLTFSQSRFLRDRKGCQRGQGRGIHESIGRLRLLGSPEVTTRLDCWNRKQRRVGVEYEEFVASKVDGCRQSTLETIEQKINEEDCLA